MHPLYDPTAYPLLFPFGDKGYGFETYKSKTQKQASICALQDETNLQNLITTWKLLQGSFIATTSWSEMEFLIHFITLEG